MAQPRILIFADDPRLCRLLVGEAEAAGFEGVATSERGKFEDHYRNTTPDLIFMEIDEPLAEVERFLALASAHPGCPSGRSINVAQWGGRTATRPIHGPCQHPWREYRWRLA